VLSEVGTGETISVLDDQNDGHNYNHLRTKFYFAFEKAGGNFDESAIAH
jgi:hypothetical protein